MSGAGGDDDVPPPRVPTESLESWVPVEQSVERLFGVDGADVRGHTLVYEDRRLRAAVREATDGAVDQLWRFCFATRLAFRPPLAPGTAPLILPSVRQQATREFCADLRDRGVEDVETGRRERVRTDDRRRRVRQVTGTVRTAAGAVTIEGWICVFHDDDIYVAGGAYPQGSLVDALDLDDAVDAEGKAVDTEVGTGDAEDEAVDTEVGTGDASGETVDTEDGTGDANSDAGGTVLRRDPAADRDHLLDFVTTVG